MALESSSPGFQTEDVLAINLPPGGLGRTPAQTRTFFRDVRQRLASLPGVRHAVVGSNVPWRDVGGGPTRLNPRPGGMQFAIEGAATAASADRPQARGRAVSSDFFTALGIPLLAGREFTDDDTAGGERVVIVSASIARQLFPGENAPNRKFRWADPVAKFVNFSEEPRRIVGVVADLDDEQVDPGADDGLPSDRAGDARGAPVRGDRGHQRLRPGAGDRASGPRAVVEPARRTGRDARRHPRSRAVAGASQHGGARHLRRRGAVDFHHRDWRRAGVLGERTPAGVRCPAGHRLAARTTALRRTAAGRGHGAGGHRARPLRGLGARGLRRRIRHRPGGEGPRALAGAAALVLLATVLAALAPALRASRTDPVQALRAD